MIKVSMGKVPGSIQDFMLDESTKLGDALQVAEINTEGYSVRVNSETVTDMSRVLAEGDSVLVARQIKGNAGEFKVSMGKVPGAIQDYMLSEGTTLQDALNIAEIDIAGYSVRINSETVTDMSRVLAEGDSVLVARQIKGN